MDPVAISGMLTAISIQIAKEIGNHLRDESASELTRQLLYKTKNNSEKILNTKIVHQAIENLTDYEKEVYKDYLITLHKLDENKDHKAEILHYDATLRAFELEMNYLLTNSITKFELLQHQEFIYDQALKKIVDSDSPPVIIEEESKAVVNRKEKVLSRRHIYLICFAGNSELLDLLKLSAPNLTKEIAPKYSNLSSNWKPFFDDYKKRKLSAPLTELCGKSWIKIKYTKEDVFLDEIEELIQEDHRNIVLAIDPPTLKDKDFKDMLLNIITSSKVSREALNVCSCKYLSGETTEEYEIILKENLGSLTCKNANVISCTKDLQKWLQIMSEQFKVTATLNYDESVNYHSSIFQKKNRFDRFKEFFVPTKNDSGNKKMKRL